MDEDEEFQLSELVYLDRGRRRGYVWWKQTTEEIIGRTLDSTEANEMYDMISGRAGF